MSDGSIRARERARRRACAPTVADFLALFCFAVFCSALLRSLPSCVFHLTHPITSHRIVFPPSQANAPRKCTTISIVGGKVTGTGRDAVGARVSYQARGRTFYKRVRNVQGFNSQSAREICLLLDGPEGTKAKIEVLWPGKDRKVTSHDVHVGERAVVES